MKHRASGMAAALGVAAVAAVSLTGTANAGVPQDTLEAIAALQASVNALQATVTSLQGSVGGVQSNTTGVQASLQQLQASVPRAWSQALPAPARFVSALGGDAVLDQETGLVWEKAPQTTFDFRWSFSHNNCNSRTIAGRMGWRLPTVQELGSLVDPSQPSGLPAGHPFVGVQPGGYWSATSALGDTDDERRDTYAFAWIVSFSGINHAAFAEKIENHHVWCVRGGPGVTTP